jgi:D-tyrosyl-tRNA(Tyr) deacylase
MRAVVQRVSSAEVRIGEGVTASIGTGLLVFLGVTQGDGPEDVRYIAEKIAGLRIFPDDAGKMNRAVDEVQGAVLVVPQFTLYGDARKGRRPSFDRAAVPAVADALYRDVVRRLAERNLAVETGVFRARMEIGIVNDGPVTILLDSSRQF